MAAGESRWNARFNFMKKGEVAIYACAMVFQE
jgi:hypothetical protein